jgi:hypothetical protein
MKKWGRIRTHRGREGAERRKDVARRDGYRELIDACRRGVLTELAEEYLRSCPMECESEEAFPNVAGFCRYLGIGVRELEALRAEEGSEVEKVYALLEDAALSHRHAVAVSLLGDYLKKRIGYGESGGGDGEIRAVFEHDIGRDGA